MPKRGKKVSDPVGVQVYAPPTEAVGVSPSAAAPSPAFQALKPSQRVVVSAFLDPSKPSFLNATQAYKAAHPKASGGTPRVEGPRTLSKPAVLAAVSEELQARGWSRERIESELVWNLTRARELDQLTNHREANMALAKVQGLLVDKQEVKSTDDKTLDAMRRIVNEELTKGESGS